jgi:ParB family chromosome partitioning protein
MADKKKKNVLGRGLEALIPQKSNVLQASQAKHKAFKQVVLEVPIGSLKKSALQPRVIFNQEKLSELSKSIQENGILQPILVRTEGDHYKIIAGERRFRAAKMLGLQSVPVIVKETNDEKSLEFALIENIQREDLNPIEEAEAYHKLLKEYGLTQEAVAEKVGKSRSAVANSVRLLKLPFEVQNFVIEQKLSMGHIRCLLSLESPDKQVALARKAIDNDWSVRELESVVMGRENENPQLDNKKSKKKTAFHAHEDVHIRDFVEKIEHRFSCRAKLEGNFEKGEIQLQYYSREDLDRLLHLLLS